MFFRVIASIAISAIVNTILLFKKVIIQMFSLFFFIAKILIVWPLLYIQEIIIRTYNLLALLLTIFIKWPLFLLEKIIDLMVSLIVLVAKALIVYPLMLITVCITRTVSLLFTIVSTIATAISFIWSVLPKLNFRKNYKAWCILIVLSFMCIVLYKYTTNMMVALKLVQDDNAKL